MDIGDKISGIMECSAYASATGMSVDFVGVAHAMAPVRQSNNNCGVSCFVLLSVSLLLGKHLYPGRRLSVSLCFLVVLVCTEYVFTVNVHFLIPRI